MGFHCSQQMDGQFCHGGLTKKSFRKATSGFLTPSLAVVRVGWLWTINLCIVQHSPSHLPEYIVQGATSIEHKIYYKHLSPLPRAIYSAIYSQIHSAFFNCQNYVYVHWGGWMKKDWLVASLSALGPNVMLSLKTRDLLSHSIQKPKMPKEYVKAILLPSHLLWKDVWANQCLVFISVV